MDWSSSYQDSSEIEEIPYFPELPLEDVQRILFLTNSLKQEECEFKEEEQIPSEGPGSVSSSGYCSEFTFSDNISVNCDEIKEEEMRWTHSNDHAASPHHLKC